MRLLKRNLVGIYYANYSDQEEIIDEYGNRTGQYDINRTNPVKTRGNVSENKGTVEVQSFGSELDYDKTIAFEDCKTPIDENTVLWIENSPINESYDYVVKKVARSLNYLVVAVKKVIVNEN